MQASALLAVGGGAVLGAWARWWLGMALNPVFPTVPLGTLAANLIGGYLIGAAMELIAHHAWLTPELRLALITGFLGSLTTFSTFSAETVTLLARHEYGWAFAAIAAHLLGSLAMTVLGIFTLRVLFSLEAP